MGGSRFPQESYGTSGLELARGSIFLVIASLIGYLIKAIPTRVGFSEPLTLNLSSQSQGLYTLVGSHIWRIGSGVSELLARVIFCSATGLPPSPCCDPQCSWPRPVKESALVPLRAGS